VIADRQDPSPHRSRHEKHLKARKISEFNVTETTVAGRITRVGNSLAIFIPAETARRAGLGVGDRVEATLRSSVPEPFGLLRDIAKARFDRRKEGDWRDRV
jgi:bifunctional DNA-binding transcriptional regulator/antitoxin component of YhaV-PrlF toxin-antitoxin module